MTAPNNQPAPEGFRIPTEHELWVCTHIRKCGWRGVYSELNSVPSPKHGAGSYTSVCPQCGCETFYIKDARKAKNPKLTATQAFHKLHEAWLSAKHRADMNDQMDAMANALGLDPMTLKPK